MELWEDTGAMELLMIFPNLGAVGYTTPKTTCKFVPLKHRPLKPQKETPFQVLCVSFRKGCLSLLPWHKQAIIWGHMTQFWLHLTHITWPLGYAKCLLACFCLPMKLQNVCKSSWVLSGFLQFYSFFSVFCSTWFMEKPLRSSSSTYNIIPKTTYHPKSSPIISSFKVVSYSTSQRAPFVAPHVLRLALQKLRRPAFELMILGDGLVVSRVTGKAPIYNFVSWHGIVVLCWSLKKTTQQESTSSYLLYDRCMAHCSMQNDNSHINQT